jgi:protease IV
MKRFFRYLLAVILGGMVTTLVMFFIFLIFMSVLAARSKKPYEVKEESVYHLKLDKPIQERAPENILDAFSGWTGSESATLGLNDILANIEKAKNDPNIKGILLDLTFLQAGTATTDAIRESLSGFKESGKFIIAYGDFYGKKAYYLATVADKIYMNPMGVLEFTGLKSEISFFKGLFDKLEIEPTVFRVGKFKSFGERFDSKTLSKENEQQIKGYVQGVWDLMLATISEERGISVNQLNQLASGLSVDTPEKALESQLIDSLKYWDEVIEEVKTNMGLAQTKDIKLVPHSLMNKVETAPAHRGFIKEKVAVVYAWGGVQMGFGEEGTIGADRISKAIREAREDSAVKAVVLRVNSGGGSALASEVIWREMDLTRQVKPVVASMGDVAASGGYYVLAPAHYIMANPYTITGSIGVVGILFNAQDFFNNKLGITHEVVKTNPYADFGSIFRPLEPAEVASVNNMLGTIYNSFVGHVAEARGMGFQAVDSIAQGRVWFAQDAHRINLVDGFGNLNDAIEKAAELAQVEKYRVEELPKLKEPLERLLDDTAEKIKMNAGAKTWGQLGIYLKEIDQLLNAGKYQAVLPYHIEIQ